MIECNMQDRADFWNSLPLAEIKKSFYRSVQLYGIAGLQAVSAMIGCIPLLFNEDMFSMLVVLGLLTIESIFLLNYKKKWSRIILFLLYGLSAINWLIACLTLVFYAEFLWSWGIVICIDLIILVIVFYCLLDKNLFSKYSLSPKQIGYILKQKEKDATIMAEKLEELDRHNNIYLSHQMIFIYVAVFLFLVCIVKYF